MSKLGITITRGVESFKIVLRSFGAFVLKTFDAEKKIVLPANQRK